MGYEALKKCLIDLRINSSSILEEDPRTVLLIVKYEEDSVVPILRQALMDTLSYGEETTSTKFSDYDSESDFEEESDFPLAEGGRVIEYQGQLLLALGYFAAWGALLDFSLDAPTLAIWRVHLTLGYLLKREATQFLVQWNDNPVLMETVRTVLFSWFGLSSSEAEAALLSYEKYYDYFRVASSFRFDLPEDLR